MKKWLSVLMVLLFAGPAFAKLDSKGKFVLGAAVDYGYTEIGMMSVYGRISGDYEHIYGAGITAGYGVFKSGIIYTGLEFQHRELAVNIEEVGGRYKETFRQDFIDIPLACRLLFGPCYVDLGGFYGVRAGDMKYKDTGYYSESGTVMKKYTNDDYGVLLGIGGIIPVGDNGGIEVGLKGKRGFSYIIDSPGYKLGCWSAALTVGYLTLL